MLRSRDDRFLGRTKDVTHLSESLAAARLASIVGPPGIGKTRLALEYVRANASTYDRVVLGPLTAAATLGAALATLGLVLDLELPALPEAELPAIIGQAIARVPATLLVLDNFEQLAPIAQALLPGILAAAPEAHVLVTSRHRLRLTGERVHELRGLDCHNDSADSIVLLLDRVRRHRGDYTPSPAERAQLCAIAERLQGVPLALELAAIRIATLGADNVLSHLRRPLDLLTENVRDSDPAQASLRGAVGRSWALLSEGERSLLEACSVFRGGFDLAAVTSLAEAPAILDALHELSEKSLLSKESSEEGATRFFLYENIREFAAEHLPTARYASLVLKHAAYYVALGSELAGAVEGPRGAAALDALIADRANLLAIVARALEEDVLPCEDGFRALLALVPLALARGPIAPLVDRLDEALAAPAAPRVRPRYRIAAQLAVARGRRRLNQVDEAKRAQEDALALAEAVDDPTTRDDIRSALAMTLVAEGAMEDAHALLTSSPRLANRSHDRSGTALDQLRLAMAQRELGDVAAAERSALDAVDVFRRDRNAAQTGVAYAELAHIAIELADNESARRYLDLGVEAGAPSTALLTDAALTARMGMLALAEAALDRAETLLSAALMGLRRIGYRRFEAGVTGYLGVVDLDAGRLDRARDRFARSTEMLLHDPRARGVFAGWLSAAEVARGDLPAARRAAAGVGRLRAHDPLSVVAHLLTVPLDRATGRDSSATLALPEALLEGNALSIRLRSQDVRLALRHVASTRGQGSPSAPDEGEVESKARGLIVSASGAWFHLHGGERVDCRRFRTLRLLLVKLAEHRLVQPGRPVPFETLVEAGWPGEKILPGPARNRLKVAIASLRKLGLREMLVYEGDGYCIDGNVAVVVLGD